MDSSAQKEETADERRLLSEPKGMRSASWDDLGFSGTDKTTVPPKMMEPVNRDRQSLAKADNIRWSMQRTLASNEDKTERTVPVLVTPSQHLHREPLDANDVTSYPGTVQQNNPVITEEERLHRIYEQEQSRQSFKGGRGSVSTPASMRRYEFNKQQGTMESLGEMRNNNYNYNYSARVDVDERYMRSNLTQRDSSVISELLETPRWLAGIDRMRSRDVESRSLKNFNQMHVNTFGKGDSGMLSQRPFSDMKAQVNNPFVGGRESNLQSESSDQGGVVVTSLRNRHSSIVKDMMAYFESRTTHDIGPKVPGQSIKGKGHESHSASEKDSTSAIVQKTLNESENEKTEQCANLANDGEMNIKSSKETQNHTDLSEVVDLGDPNGVEGGPITKATGSPATTTGIPQQADAGQTESENDPVSKKKDGKHKGKKKHHKGMKKKTREGDDMTDAVEKQDGGLDHVTPSLNVSKNSKTAKAKIRSNKDKNSPLAEPKLDVIHEGEDYNTPTPPSKKPGSTKLLKKMFKKRKEHYK